MRIFKNAWFARFAQGQKISDAMLCEAIARAERGQVDANLGGDVVKQRIARHGQGKSKGYRAIILLQKRYRAFFVYGFAKSERANISQDEEVQFKKMAKHVLGLSEDQLDILMTKGLFEEVQGHDKEISK